MPDFLPFKALRPGAELMGVVSARSTDFANQQFLVDAMRSNPYSFHHVTKNHLNYSGAFQEPEKFLPFAAKFIEDRKADGVLVKEDRESYYVYKQVTKDGRRFKGIVGLSSVQDYQRDLIKKHENVRLSRLNFMIELCKTTRVLGEPTLITYHGAERLPLDGGELISDFTSVDGKRHIIERISDPEHMGRIHTALQGVDAFYLADGHHRSAAIAEFHNRYPQLDNSHFLSLLMHEEDLEVRSFHRMIREVEHLDNARLLELLRKDFLVEAIDRTAHIPERRAEFGMYNGEGWYRLSMKHPDHMMDVELLEKYVVHSIYHIKDSRTDGQISFTPQHTPVAQLEEMVDSGAFHTIFTIKECAFHEIREVADRFEVLPPKSTFIEPKLRAGMLIQEF